MKRPFEYDKIKILFNWGIISYGLRLFVVNFTLINRVFSIFLIISIFPLVFYLSDISAIRKKIYYIIIWSLIAVYSAKVLLFPTGEYDYDSIYF